MRRAKAVVGVLGIGLSLFAGCSVETRASDIICVHDQTDICTNCDRPEGDTRPYRGRHTCASDGKSFGACLECAPITDETKVEPTGFKPVPPATKPDAGPTPTAPAIDAACNGRMTLVAGRNSPDDPFVYAAVLVDGAFTVLASSGAPMRSPGAFVVNGKSILGVYRSKGNALVASSFADGVWAPPAAVPVAQTDGAPTIATWGPKSKAIFRATDGRYNAVDWDPATGWSPVTIVGSATATPPTGVSAPSAATVGAPGVKGSGIMFGYTDADGGLYRQDWNGTSWRSSGLKSTVAAAPMRTALLRMNGGSFDLVSAFVAADARLNVAMRSVSDSISAWSDAQLVSDAARPLDGVSGVALPNGRALLVYRDAEKKGWFTIFDPRTSPKWSAPAELVAGANPVLASTPQLAEDTCGAEASLAYAEEGGAVAILRFAGDAWTGPFPVENLSNMTYAAVAVIP